MRLHQILKIVKNGDYESLDLTASEPFQVNNLINIIRNILPFDTGEYIQIKTGIPLILNLVLFSDHVLVWYLNYVCVNQLFELTDLDEDESYLVLKYGKIILEEIVL